MSNHTTDSTKNQIKSIYDRLCADYDCLQASKGWEQELEDNHVAKYSLDQLTIQAAKLLEDAKRVHHAEVTRLQVELAALKASNREKDSRIELLEIEIRGLVAIIGKI